MFEKIRNLKNKKGFTLVELIVVLVILAILAALLVPALTGCIDKARTQSIIAETRQAVMAAQTIASEKYASADADLSTWAKSSEDTKAVEKLAELADGSVGPVSFVAGGGEKAGKVNELTYTKGTRTCVYHATEDASYVDGHYEVS